MSQSLKSIDKTWDQVIFSILQIFSNGFTTANKSMVENDLSNTNKLTIDVVWVNLKFMIVVDGFNKSGIKNHPSMNRYQVIFPKAVQECLY